MALANRSLKPLPPSNVATVDTSSLGSYFFNAYVTWSGLWAWGALPTTGANGAISANSSAVWYAGAYSSNQASAGEGGRLTFKANTTTQYRCIGLTDSLVGNDGAGGSGGAGSGLDLVRFGFWVKGNGKAEIWEQGVRKSAVDAITYTTATVFEIQVSATGAVTYYKDGVLQYTSAVALATVETYALRTVITLGAYGAHADGGGFNNGTQTLTDVHFRSPASIGVTGQVALSWKKRSRLVTAIKKQTDTSDTLETGQTYTIRIYNHAGTLIRTVTGETGESYNYTAATELADTGSGSLQASLTFRIKSVRDGYESNEVVKVVTR